jgi:hypothetical protein
MWTLAAHEDPYLLGHPCQLLPGWPFAQQVVISVT